MYVSLRTCDPAQNIHIRSESTLDRILIHRGVLAEKLFFSGDPRLFLEGSSYKVSPLNPEAKADLHTLTNVLCC